MQRKRLDGHVVDFYIHNKPVSKGMKSGRFDIIDTPVHQETVFQLAYRDNSFTIEFSTMDFSDSERVIFQYSMNGNAWVSLRPSNNRLPFENLSHGTHRLPVRAAAANAISKVKEIAFVIHPVWFLSTTAEILYLVITMLLAAMIFKTAKNRRHIRKQMRSQRQRQEINDAKLQLFVSIAQDRKSVVSGKGV